MGATTMRDPRWWLAGALVALAAAGCSGGPEERDGPAQPVVAAGPSRTAAATTTSAAPAATTEPAGTPTGTPTGTPVGTPARVAVPATVLLRGADWPGGKVTGTGPVGPGSYEQTEPAACQQDTAFPSDRHRLAGRAVSIASAEPESGGLHQVVVRYAPGRAAQLMAEARRVLAACTAGYRPAGTDEAWTRRYRLEAQGVAGDDSLLVRQVDTLDQQPGREWATLVSIVRVGDAVLTTSSEVGEGAVDLALARTLATTGARRAACLRTTC
jgi:hypothetical protein